MKINLLPEQTRRPSSIDLRMVAAALAAFIMVSGMGYGYWHLEQEAFAKRQTLVELQTTYETLRPIEVKGQALEQARQKLQSAEQAKAFLVQPILTSEILIELTQILPQDVLIRSLAVTADGSVQMRGQGSAMGSAARTLAQLGRSKYLSDPRMSIVSGDGSTYVFDLTARLNKGGATP